MEGLLPSDDVFRTDDDATAAAAAFGRGVRLLEVRMLLLLPTTGVCFNAVALLEGLRLVDAFLSPLAAVGDIEVVVVVVEVVVAEVIVDRNHHMNICS